MLACDRMVEPIASLHVLALNLQTSATWAAGCVLPVLPELQKNRMTKPASP